MSALINPWSHVACVQPALITPLQWNTQWIAAVNPKAGGFQAMEVAGRVADLVGPRMTIYETAKDDRQRVRDLTALIAGKRPSLKNPLGVLAFGGDRTCNDALLGVLYYIFPHISDLWELSADKVLDRMLDSGIQLGTIRQGGANDVGGVYGSPKDNAGEIMDFMDEGLVTSLNMGVAFLDGIDEPQIFGHSLGAGETIATVYEKTTEERGKRAKWHREALFVWHVLRHQKLMAHWAHSNGQTGSSPILEVLIHAVTRADEKIGLPGTPQPGLGTKIFPALGRWAALKTFRETLSIGSSSKDGDPKLLPPDGALATIDPLLQPQLLVGDELDLRFTDFENQPFQTAAMGNGDYIGRTHHLRARGLIPFPRFMTSQRALMAQMHRP